MPRAGTAACCCGVALLTPWVVGVAAGAGGWGTRAPGAPGGEQVLTPPFCCFAHATPDAPCAYDLTTWLHQELKGWICVSVCSVAWSLYGAARKSPARASSCSGLSDTHSLLSLAVAQAVCAREVGMPHGSCGPGTGPRCDVAGLV